MINEYFGEMNFSIGWKTKREIQLFGKTYNITVTIQASNPEQAFPEIQKQAFLAYTEHEKDNLCDIEKMMIEYCDYAESRFSPRTLLFKKNGMCSLLCDDEEDPDDGIAVCVFPQKYLMSQDEFL